MSRGVFWLPWPTAENIPIRSFFSSFGPLTLTSRPWPFAAREASSASASGVRCPAGSFTRVRAKFAASVTWSTRASTCSRDCEREAPSGRSSRTASSATRSSRPSVRYWSKR